MRSILLCFLLISSSVFAQRHYTWDYVYDNNRLTLIEDSITVTGTIHNMVAEIDGDIHIQLKMDSFLNKLLVSRNYIKQDSCLVVELVCVNESPFKKCYGYNNNITVPKIGDIVQVTGAYVFDRRHKWTEIHPVYDLKILGSKFW